MESIAPQLQSEDQDLCWDWNNWPYARVFDDMDIVTFLYSGGYLTKDHSYHFDHWREDQFYCAS